MFRLSRNARLILSIALFFSLVSLACGVSAPIITSSQPTVAVEPVQVVPTALPTSSVAQLSTISAEDQVVSDIYSRLNPSVVNITVYLNENGTLAPLAQGSGFIYDTQGHIITNAHVVNGVDAVEVTFSNGLIHEASIVGDDLYSDLAVIKTDLPQGLSPLSLGNMEGLAVGQTVIAIGNPFGFEGTLTRGVISGLGRTIPTQTQYSIPQAIQTDAAINPGNSGGPLLNLNGEVIGVNAQIETSGTSVGNVGVGFAVPVSIIDRVVPALIQNGSYAWPWLGIAGGTVNPQQVKAMNLPVELGAYVSTVTAAGPAEAAGIQGTTQTVTQDNRQVEVGGDVLTAIDGQSVDTFDDLLVYLALQTSPGQKVTLKVFHNNQYQDVQVTLGTRPSQ